MASTPRQTPASTRRAALRRGLLDPGVGWAVAGLLVTVALALGLNALVVSGRATAIPESLLLRDPRDDWLHVSYQVARLKLHPPQAPAVYILGGSATRESFVGEKSLGAGIAAAGGGHVEVHELASNNQEFAGDLAIVDNLPRTPAVVVIGVGMERFVHGPDSAARQVGGRPLLIWSDALKRLVVAETGDQSHAETILPGLADFVVTWTHWRANRLRLGLPVRIRFKQHLYTRDMAFSDARKRAQVKRWLEHRGKPGGQFDRVFDYNARVLERVVSLARQRGFSVVLLENPLNTDIVGDSFAHMIDRCRPLYERLATDYGATYVDFLPKADLKSRDFRDLTHMLYSGEVKYETQLAPALAPITAQLP